MIVTLTKHEQEMNRRDGFESLISRFNRKVQTSGLFRELKDVQYYEKPSDRKRRKKREAIAKAKRREKPSAVYNTRSKRPNRPSSQEASGASSD